MAPSPVPRRLMAVMRGIRDIHGIPGGIGDDSRTYAQPILGVDAKADGDHADGRVRTTHDGPIRSGVIKRELAVADGHVGRENGTYLFECSEQKDARVSLSAAYIDLQSQTG